MTRRRESAPAPDPDPGAVPGDELIDSPEEVDIYDEITRLAAETGGGGARKIVVKKKRADGTGWDRCRQFTVQELDRLDLIPELFGGGQFTLTLIDAANRYMKVFPVSWPVDIYPKPQLPQVAAQAAPAAGVDRIAEMMMAIQRESQAAQDRYMTLLQTLVTSLVAPRAASAPASLSDRVAELTAIKALMGEAPKPPLDLLKEAIQIGAQLGKGKIPNPGGGDDPDDDEGEGGGMMRVVEKGLSILERAVERGQGVRRAAGAAGAAAAGPRAVAAVPENLKPYAWLGKYVPEAIRFAKGGITAPRAASALYALIPDEHLDVLEQFARTDRAERQQILLGLDQRLNPYLAFLDELAAEFVTIFDREAEDERADDQRDRAGETEPAEAS